MVVADLPIQMQNFHFFHPSNKENKTREIKVEVKVRSNEDILVPNRLGGWYTRLVLTEQGEPRY
jgi:hypothetical protein